MKSKTLALHLKVARTQAGFSQAVVAQHLGYSNAQFVSNWERGICAPPYKVLNELIKIYRLDRVEIIEFILDDMRLFLESVIF